MTTASWLDDAKSADIAQTAQRLGLEVKTGMRLRLQCPACGETRSGRSDKRPPCSAGRDGRWRCWLCSARGDVVDLVSYVVAGDRYSGQQGVREWWTGDVGVSVRRVAARAPAPPRYPPHDEVLRVLGAAVAPQQDADVWRWLTERFGPLIGLEDVHLACSALRWSPPWARFAGQTWAETGHRAIFPALDSDGVVRSVRARRVVPGGTPKALPPAGYDCGGLVLANRSGRLLLGGVTTPRHVVVCEGEPAMLAWSVARPQSAVFGIGSGWWTKAHANKIATGSTVLVATDADEAGERYAAQVRSTLGGRCVVQRWSS